MRENADQNNSKYGHFSGSASHDHSAFTSEQLVHKSKNWPNKYLAFNPSNKCEAINSLVSKYQLQIKLKNKLGQKANIWVKSKKSSWWIYWYGVWWMDMEFKGSLNNDWRSAGHSPVELLPYL